MPDLYDQEDQRDHGNLRSIFTGALQLRALDPMGFTVEIYTEFETD